MKKYLIILWIFLPLSCSSQKKEIISKSTIKLDGKNTNIRDIINIDGLYRDISDSAFAISNNVMFFEDGSYTWSFHFKEGVTYDNINRNMSEWVKKWDENKQIRWGGYWGVYRIEGDTIIGNYFEKGLLLRCWTFGEERYKIMDSTTIKKIYLKSLLKGDENYYNSKSPWLSNEVSVHFVPADSLPSSDCWLKEEKWIWRNESDWKSYMEKINQKSLFKKNRK
jgi:hypothetical protein